MLPPSEHRVLGSYSFSLCCSEESWHCILCSLIFSYVSMMWKYIVLLVFILHEVHRTFWIWISLPFHQFWKILGYTSSNMSSSHSVSLFILIFHFYIYDIFQFYIYDIFSLSFMSLTSLFLQSVCISLHYSFYM